MPTINQLVRKGRGKKIRKPKSPVLLVGINTIQKKQTKIKCSLNKESLVKRSKTKTIAPKIKQIIKKTLLIILLSPWLKWTKAKIILGAINKIKLIIINPRFKKESFAFLR